MNNLISSVKKFRIRKRNVFIIIIVSILAVGLFWKLSSKSLSTIMQTDTPTRLDNTAWLDTHFNWKGLNPLVYTVPETIYPRGLNLLFIADAFNTQDEFIDAVDVILKAMKQTEPWKSHAEINAFLIFQNSSTICMVKEENSYAPVLKCGKELIALAQTLPLVNVKVVVLSRQSFVSWANVSRFENSFVFYSMPESKQTDTFNLKIFIHEFAHGFGLRDETRSIIADSGSAPARPEGPNCAPNVAVAKLWWGKYLKHEDGALIFDSTNNDVGFYFGCAGNQDYLRPTQKSLMNIQDFPDADTYGLVSEDYLRKVLKYCYSSTIYSKIDDAEFVSQYPDFAICFKS